MTPMTHESVLVLRDHASRAKTTIMRRPVGEENHPHILGRAQLVPMQVQLVYRKS